MSCTPSPSISPIGAIEYPNYWLKFTSDVDSPPIPLPMGWTLRIVPAAAGLGLGVAEGDVPGINVIEGDVLELDVIEGDVLGLDVIEGDVLGLDAIEGDVLGLDVIEGDVLGLGVTDGVGLTLGLALGITPPMNAIATAPAFRFCSEYRGMPSSSSGLPSPSRSGVTPPENNRTAEGTTPDSRGDDLVSLM